jgi:biotin carboxyl carrier protein
VVVVAPMPGRVVQVLVSPGQVVAAGQALVVVEAMKMENDVTAPVAGTVIEVPATEGVAVDGRAVLAVLEPKAEANREP